MEINQKHQISNIVADSCKQKIVLSICYLLISINFSANISIQLMSVVKDSHAPRGYWRDELPNSRANIKRNVQQLAKRIKAVKRQQMAYDTSTTRLFSIGFCL